MSNTGCSAVTPINTRMRVRLGGLVLLPGWVKVRRSATPYKKAWMNRARQICDLYYRHGLTHREIAKMLCMTSDGKKRKPVTRQMVSLILGWATRRLYEEGKIRRAEDVLHNAVSKAIWTGFRRSQVGWGMERMLALRGRSRRRGLSHGSRW